MAVGFGFCSSCGAPLTKAQQRFCGVCGAAIPVRGAPPAATAAQAPTATPTAPPAPTAAPPAAPTAPAPPNAAPEVPFPYGQPPAQAAVPYGQPPEAYPGAVPVAPLGPTAAGAKPASSSTPLVLGVVAVAAIVVGAFVVMNANNGNKPGPLPGSSTAIHSAAPSVATPTVPPAQGKATVNVIPAKFACADPGDATLHITLPASFTSDQQVAFMIDGSSLGSDTVGSVFTQKADGSWSTDQTEQMTSLCTNYGPGNHVVTLLDASQNLLAQTSFTILGSAATPTPNPGGGAVIQIQPTQFSCSAAGQEVQMAIVLPASIDPELTVTLTLDGQELSSSTVADGFVQQSDGTWLSSGSIAASDLCAAGTGQHVVKMVDDQGNTLAQAGYTATP